MGNSKRNEVLGADGRAILIQVRNAPQLARAQGGLATLASALAPDTIDHEVNKKIASELASAFKKQSVVADVRVVEPAEVQRWYSASSPFWRNALIGLGVLSVLGLTYKMVRK